MPDPDLTVIIVSYNSFDTIQRCLDAWLSNPTYPIIVVDNASTDSSASKIRDRYPAVTVMAEPINLGYGRAANRALLQVNTPYALLLNPDILATEEQARQLVERAKALGPELALLAPAVKRKDYTQRGLLKRDWVIGAAMLFNMRVLERVGLFDEEIFLFSEETDLCKRIRAQNLDIYLDTDLFMDHLYKQSSTPSEQIEHLKNWHMGWSRAYYRRKHGLNIGKKAEWRVVANYFLKWLLATNPEKRNLYRARLAGTQAFLRGEPAFLADGQPRELPGASPGPGK